MALVAAKLAVADPRGTELRRLYHGVRQLGRRRGGEVVQPAIAYGGGTWRPSCPMRLPTWPVATGTRGAAEGPINRRPALARGVAGSHTAYCCPVCRIARRCMRLGRTRPPPASAPARPPPRQGLTAVWRLPVLRHHGPTSPLADGTTAANQMVLPGGRARGVVRGRTRVALCLASTARAGSAVQSEGDRPTQIDSAIPWGRSHAVRCPTPPPSTARENGCRCYFVTFSPGLLMPDAATSDRQSLH